MLKAIIDTHAILWRIFDDPRLSGTVNTFLDTAEAEGNQIGLSQISLAEVVYLTEKGRIQAASFSELVNLLNLPNTNIVEVAFDRNTAETMLRYIDRKKIPDLHDRMIAATALYWNVPLISRDAKIQASGLATMW